MDSSEDGNGEPGFNLRTTGRRPEGEKMKKLLGFCVLVAALLVSVGATGQPLPPTGCTANAGPPSLPASGGSIFASVGCTGGTPPFTGFWYLDGNLVVNNRPMANGSAVEFLLIPANTKSTPQIHTVTITVCNASGCNITAPVSVTVAAAPPPPPSPPSGCALTPSPAILPAGGGPVTLTASCSSGDPPTSYAWTGPGVPSQTSSPTVSTSITSTATFTVTASNAAGSAPTATVQVIVARQITLAPTSLPNGVVGAPYSQTLIANGGDAPYTFTVSSGALPNGLSLNPQTGLISGTPTSAGSANFTITATDSQGVTGSQSYSITVAAPTGTIQPVSGDKQVALPATPVAQNFVAKVVNGQGNPVQGAAVTWSVQQGGGTISAATLISDAQGLVHAGYTTGADPQNDNIVRVTATGSGSFYDFTVRNLQQRVVVPAKQLIGPLAQVAVNTPTIQLNNIRQRLDQLRLQSSPTVAEGLRASYDGRSLPPMGAFALAPLDKDSKPQPQIGGGASADKPDSFERWGVFVSGDVDIGRRATTDTQTGFKVTSKGITLGADYRLPGNNVLGASLGFLKADTDLDAGAGTQNAKGYSFSLYGSYVPQENAYIDGILNVGHNKYDSNRQTSTDSFSSSTNGNQWGLAVSAGYAFNRGPLALTPYGRVEYVNAKVNGFTENGNMDGALIIGSQQIKGTTLTLGGQVSYAVSTSWGVLLPNARLELQHLAQRSVSDVSARIVNQDITSPSAQIPFLGEDRNFGNFAAGVSAVFPRGVSAFFNYQQLFGKESLSDRHYTLGLRVDL